MSYVISSDMRKSELWAIGTQSFVTRYILFLPLILNSEIKPILQDLWLNGNLTPEQKMTACAMKFVKMTSVTY